MTESWKALGRALLHLTIWMTAFAFVRAGLWAQPIAPQLTEEIDEHVRVIIQGTHSPMARTENDLGRVPPGTQLDGISMVFNRTSAQEADLQALIAAQQNPASKFYHKWLTPEEFAARFGASDGDIAMVESWLEQQGFSVDGVSRSKNRITFSGAVEQAETAFGTEIHYYKTNGETHYAPAGYISVPAALSPLVKTVTNLSSFRPRPHVRLRAPQPARPYFTSSQSGSHFLTPKDVATIYDISSAYNAGYTGADESIAVVGQSAIVVSDIEKFQSAAGLAIKDPTLVLVPNSGSSTIYSNDEVESDLDLEYTGGIATGAKIYFVYVGSSANYTVFDSIDYAIENNIAPIISVSYGACETSLSSSDYSTLNGILAQAATQGQSVIVASGDSGSTDCYGQTGLSTAQRQALAVDFPASSQYVTGLGGTEFSSADVSSSNTTYWKSASGADVIGSALSYIPEQVWNDDSSSNGIASGGGGVSSFTSRPSWQRDVAGIPDGSYRLVPDISLDSSTVNAGYLFCSSDPATQISGSCSNGFRDSNNEYLTVGGGTSFASPIFAGMLALINQRLGSAGQGVINPVLYTLATDSSSYASAFHDIVSGSNACTAGASYCSSTGASKYSAASGYDEASGLGSVDLYNLLSSWPTSSSKMVASTTTLSPQITSPAVGVSDTVTITVASGSSSGTTTPSGTLTVVVDGTTENSSLVLTNGSATYVFSFTTTGAHTITVTYSGDSTYAPSTGTLTLTVVGSPSFALTATNVTVSAGNTGTSTITITPKNGYTGTIGWTITSSPALTNGCLLAGNTTVSGTSAISSSLAVYTKSSACSSSADLGTDGRSRKLVGTSSGIYKSCLPVLAEPWTTQICTTIAGLLVFCLIGCPGRWRRTFYGICFLALLCFAVSCGGSNSGSSSTSSNSNASTAATGTYTVTLVGTDASTASITASTTMILTIE